MRSRAPLVVVVWIAGVLLATATGLLAVRLVADQVGDPPVPVLSADDVRRAVPTAVPRTSPASPPPQPAAAVRVFSSAGGSAGVRCTGGVPVRVYASPAQGYRLDETSLEGGVLEVRFENERTRVRLEVSCSSGNPVLVGRRTDDR